MNRLQGDVKIAEEAGNVATKTNAVLGQALQGDRARLELREQPGRPLVELCARAAASGHGGRAVPPCWQNAQ